MRNEGERGGEHLGKCAQGLESHTTEPGVRQWSRNCTKGTMVLLDWHIDALIQWNNGKNESMRVCSSEDGVTF